MLKIGDTLKYKCNGKVGYFFYGNWSLYDSGLNNYIHLYNIKNKLSPPYVPNNAHYLRFLSSHKILLIERR